MASGLNPNNVLIERFLASVSAENLPQSFVVPCDLDVVGLVANVGTAPGGSAAVKVNVSNSPTSQLATVAAYNLWTTGNVPTITGTAVNSFTTSTARTVVDNAPYALNYPLPGPSGTTGYETAQSTTQVTQSPVTAPPNEYVYAMGALLAPDNTYSDFNGVTQPASIVHAGDVLTFVVAGGSLGSSANLSVTLYCQKR